VLHASVHRAAATQAARQAFMWVLVRFDETTTKAAFF
jgi:hypothetical protein